MMIIPTSGETVSPSGRELYFSVTPEKGECKHREAFDRTFANVDLGASAICIMRVCMDI